MKQATYNKFLRDIETDKKKYAKAILSKAQKAGVNFNVAADRAIVHYLSEIQYHLAMGMLVYQSTTNNKN